MLQRDSHPMVNLALATAALRIYGKNPLHRALHEIPGANMRAAQVAGGGPSVQAYYQVVAIDPATHVAGDHEGEPAEHPLFDYIDAVRQRATHPGREHVIVGHRLNAAVAWRAFSQIVAGRGPGDPMRSRWLCIPPFGERNERARRDWPPWRRTVEASRSSGNIPVNRRSGRKLASLHCRCPPVFPSG